MINICSWRDESQFSCSHSTKSYAAADSSMAFMYPSIVWVNCASTSSAIVITSGNSKPKSSRLRLLYNVPKRVTWRIRDSCTGIAGV
jgi:hypothetical protein